MPRSSILLMTAAIALMALGIALIAGEGEEARYPTPQVVKQYKAGEIIMGTCEGFGPRCIDYKDLTHRQRVRCFTLWDATYDPFCARIRSPFGTALPIVNDYLLEGVQDPRVQAMGRQCRDVRTSCYYVVRVRGVQEHACRELRVAFEEMLDEITAASAGPPPTRDFSPLRFPGCSDHGALAHVNSSLLDPERRKELYASPPAW